MNFSVYLIYKPRSATGPQNGALWKIGLISVANGSMKLA